MIDSRRPGLGMKRFHALEWIAQFSAEVLFFFIALAFFCFRAVLKRRGRTLPRTTLIQFSGEVHCGRAAGCTCTALREMRRAHSSHTYWILAQRLPGIPTPA